MEEQLFFPNWNQVKQEDSAASGNINKHAKTIETGMVNLFSWARQVVPYLM
jgi:hypothetical protein